MIIIDTRQGKDKIYLYLDDKHEMPKKNIEELISRSDVIRQNFIPNTNQQSKKLLFDRYKKQTNKRAFHLYSNGVSVIDYCCNGTTNNDIYMYINGQKGRCTKTFLAQGLPLLFAKKYKPYNQQYFRGKSYASVKDPVKRFDPRITYEYYHLL